MSRSITYFEETIQNHIEYPKERPLLIGISGGADSVALLTALRSLGYSLIAVHCNFHLRGEESNRDQHFVKTLCSQFQIPLVTKDFAVEEYRSKNRCSIETACRDLRYDFFFKLLPEYDASAIAIAHNSDDNIETFFLNLLRGSGLKGLKGMVENSGRIIRPMLSLSRQDVEEYLDAKGISFVTDSTNLESDYRRNFLRNEVIPLIKSKWPDATKTLNLTISNINADRELLTGFLDDAVGFNKYSLQKEMILKSKSPIALIHHFLDEYGSSQSIEEEILRAVRKRDNERRIWNLKNKRAVLERESLDLISFPLKCKKNFIDTAQYQNTEENRELIRKNTNQKIFYSPFPTENYLFRPWCKGDRIFPLGMSGSSLVSDIIKDAKLPLDRKENIYVAVDKKTKKIIWVEGLKRSRFNLIDSDSRSIFRIEPE